MERRDDSVSPFPFFSSCAFDGAEKKKKESHDGKMKDSQV